MAQRVPCGDATVAGRSEELALVVAALERGGCVIAGAAGVGKSRLAVEAAVRRGAPMVRVVATAAAASIPFGAFAHELAAVHVDGRGPIAGYIELLGAGSPNRPPTLLVDDAHLLDTASAALLLAVAESEAGRLLVTLRDGVAVPDAVTALWKECGLDRLDVGPLSRPGLRALVDAHLGGPADANVHARLFSLTQGNPLYARELLIDARRSGALVETDGRWRWTGRPTRLLRLRELVDARTRQLSADGRLALELLAVGAPLRLAELAAVSGHGGVAELEGAGLAAVRGDPESLTVELAHPLFGEVVLAELPAASAREHRLRLTAALRGQDLDDSVRLLRRATLTLESGESDPELFLRAGAYALRVQAGVHGPGWEGGDPALALRLADAAGRSLDTAGRSLEAALLAARARMALGRYAEVEQGLAPLERDAARAPCEQAAQYLRSRVYALHWGASGTHEALALLERARPWRDEPNWVTTHAALSASILYDRGRPASAAEAIGDLASHDGLAAHIRLDVLTVLGLAQSRMGLTDRCEALEPEIRQLVDELALGPWDTGWARYLVDGFARAEAARDLTGVADRLEKGRERAEAQGDVPLAAALGMVLGRLALTRGHVGEAVALLADAVDGLSTGDARNALGWALADLTRARALAGDAPGARDALARAEAVAAERPSHLPLRLEIERAAAWSDVACGRLAAAPGRLLAVADGAGEALVCEAEATYDALRFGAAPRPCAERLTALAALAESELLDACADHATALAAADAQGQLHAAERFAALGLDLWAAEAAAGAARAFTAGGWTSAARRAGALSAKHAGLCPAAVTPALMLTPAGERLTVREREAATLAARGRTNTEIAEEMVLSVRTVETYILRACHKLGVERRTDLAQLLTLDRVT